MTRTIVTREWLHARIHVDENGCWIWQGRRANVYGQFRNRKAHVIAYEMFVGPVPAGLELDHLCRVTLCVNPEHLEAVTHAENVRRGRRSALKTHCDSGRHPRTPENRILRSNGATTCKPCLHERARAAAHVAGERRNPPARCPHGHAYDEANTYYRRNGWYQCRTCRRLDARKRNS